MHTWRERVWASSLMRRNTVKRQLNHLCRSVLPGLCLPLANYLVLFSHLTCPRALRNMRAQLFSKMDSSPEAYGAALASHIMGWCPLLFDPQGAFLCMCSVFLAPRMGNMWPLDPFLKQGLAPLCSCHDCYLKVSTGDKAWLFTLFLLWLPFRRAKRWLIVNA